MMLHALSNHFKMLTLLQKYLYRKSQCSKTWDSTCLALIAQMVRSFGMNPKVVGFESPSGRDIFCFKIIDTFTRTSVRVSKLTAVARAQLAFQNVNFT